MRSLSQTRRNNPRKRRISKASLNQMEERTGLNGIFVLLLCFDRIECGVERGGVVVRAADAGETRSDAGSYAGAIHRPLVVPAAQQPGRIRLHAGYSRCSAGNALCLPKDSLLPRSWSGFLVGIHRPEIIEMMDVNISGQFWLMCQRDSSTRTRFRVAFWIFDRIRLKISSCHGEFVADSRILLFIFLLWDLWMIFSVCVGLIALISGIVSD